MTGFVFDESKLPDVVPEHNPWNSEQTLWRVDDWVFDSRSDSVEDAERDVYKHLAWLLFLKYGGKK